MNKVYRHRPDAIDEFMGRVGEDGRVYESRLAPDQYVGRVDLENGEICAARAQQDQRIGRVEPDSGKVFLGLEGSEDYLGRVHPDGSLYRHRTLAANELLGRVEAMQSLAHGGGAFLLLILPAWDEAAKPAANPKEVLEAKLQTDPLEDDAAADSPAPATITTTGVGTA